MWYIICGTANSSTISLGRAAGKIGHYFFLRLIYCSEMYKCLHEFSTKTVPDTSLHETSDLIRQLKFIALKTTFMLKAVRKLSLQ